VDFVTKFEKALRKRHHMLMTEVAKIQHLIDAFEKGAKRGAKKGGSRLSAAARRKISLAQKARWAKARKAKATKG
jgi:ABC-type protease/lipase transport system fused ATPase/permease subunit